MERFIVCLIAYIKNNADVYIWILFFAVCFWGIAMFLWKVRSVDKKIRLRVWGCYLLLSLNCSFIFIMTLFAREKVEDPWGMWKPFRSYIDVVAVKDVEMLLQILVNIVMFIPFGYLLPYCLSKVRSLRNIVLVALFFSLTIELIQGVLRVGFFEIDDIINNTLGATIGGGMYFLLRKLNKYFLKR